MTKNYFIKTLYTFAIVLFIPFAGPSQDKILDSLVTVMNSKAPDTIILQTFEYMYDNEYLPVDKKNAYQNKVNAIVKRNLSKSGFTG